MMALKEQLEAARDEVSRLERLAKAATCAEVGCRLKFIGGANCGCERGDCSVPVHRCEVCGAYDYGENREADEIREKCKEAAPT